MVKSRRGQISLQHVNCLERVHTIVKLRRTCNRHARVKSSHTDWGGNCRVTRQAYSQERQKAYNLLTMEFVASAEYDSEKQTTVKMGKAREKEDAAWLQGDMDMYSPANQKKRRRLKHDPAIQVHSRPSRSLTPSC